MKFVSGLPVFFAAEHLAMVGELYRLLAEILLIVLLWRYKLTAYLLEIASVK